ncbi:MAG: hypothetical protein HZA54_19545 [Planctomycetes bacterium]|nr:hypothetical protein [Planctomycetota bacterium]
MAKNAANPGATPATDRASAVDAVLVAGALAAAGCVCAGPGYLWSFALEWALLASLGLPLVGVLLACDRLPAAERPARRPRVWPVVALLAGGAWGAVAADQYPPESRAAVAPATLAVIALMTAGSVALAAAARRPGEATWPVLALWLAATYGLALRTGLGRGGNPPAERIMLVAGAIAALAAPLVSWVCRTLGRAAARAWAGGRAIPGILGRLSLIELAIGVAILPTWFQRGPAEPWTTAHLAGAAAPLLFGAWIERGRCEGWRARSTLGLLSALAFGGGVALGVLGSARPGSGALSEVKHWAVFVGLLGAAPLLATGCASTGEALWPGAAFAIGLVLARALSQPFPGAVLEDSVSTIALVACGTALPLLLPVLRRQPRPIDGDLLRRGGVALASVGLAASAFVVTARFRGTVFPMVLSFAAALLVSLGALRDRPPDLSPGAGRAEELDLGVNWWMGMVLARWAYVCDVDSGSSLGGPSAFPDATMLAAWCLLPALLLGCALAATTRASAFWNALILSEGAMLGAVAVTSADYWRSDIVALPLLQSGLCGVMAVPALHALLQRRLGLRPLPALGRVAWLLVGVALLRGIALLR